MSNKAPAQQSSSTDRPELPRAIIHRQILNEAEARPTATPIQLAAAISGASVSFVERVLDEYGDPGDVRNGDGPAEQIRSVPVPPTDEEEPPDDSLSKDSDAVSSDPELSIQQKRTLRAIHEHPEATQRDLAEVLGVSAATVCQRMKSIPGFEWSDRRAYVSRLFDADANILEPSDDLDEQQRVLETIVHRIDSLEDRLKEQSGTTGVVTFDHDLAHKIVHACILSEHITADEELRILKGMMDHRTDQ